MVKEDKRQKCDKGQGKTELEKIKNEKARRNKADRQVKRAGDRSVQSVEN